MSDLEKTQPLQAQEDGEQVLQEEQLEGVTGGWGIKLGRWCCGFPPSDASTSSGGDTPRITSPTTEHAKAAFPDPPKAASLGKKIIQVIKK